MVTVFIIACSLLYSCFAPYQWRAAPCRAACPQDAAVSRWCHRFQRGGTALQGPLCEGAVGAADWGREIPILVSPSVSASRCHLPRRGRQGRYGSPTPVLAGGQGVPCGSVGGDAHIAPPGSMGFVRRDTWIPPYGWVCRPYPSTAITCTVPSDTVKRTFRPP